MPPPRPGGPNFGDALIQHCPTRYEKHAESITIYLQCPNRFNGRMQLFWGNNSFDIPRKKDLKIYFHH